MRNLGLNDTHGKDMVVIDVKKGWPKVRILKRFQEVP